MFAHAFQGGQAVLILDSRDKKSHDKLFKCFNQQCYKHEFDQNVKSFIITLDQGIKSQIQLPKLEKQELGLVQQFLVFQIYIQEYSSFFIDLVLTDTSNTKRRINLTSNYQKVTSNMFHAQIPNDIFKRGIWMNLSIDVHSFMQIFKGFTFRSLDQIILGSSCKLRRIFTMKYPLVQTSLEDNERNQYNAEHVPKNLSLPSNLEQMNQLVGLYDIMIKQSQLILNNSVIQNQSYIEKSPERNRNSSIKKSGHINNSIILTPQKISYKTPKKQSKSQNKPIPEKQSSKRQILQDMEIIPEKVENNNAKNKNKKTKQQNNRLQSAQRYELKNKVSKMTNLNESEYLEKSSRFNTLTNLTPDMIFNQMSISTSQKILFNPNQKKQDIKSQTNEQIEEKIEFEKKDNLQEEEEEVIKQSQIFESCFKHLIDSNLRPTSPEFEIKNIQKIKKNQKNVQQMVQLQYDPNLKQYFDPTTNQYYQNIEK